MRYRGHTAEWLSTEKVAQALGVSDDTVRRWIVFGSLPAEYVLKKAGGTRRVYRVHQKHVDKILAGLWPARQG